jgi:hypothetical protein
MILSVLALIGTGTAAAAERFDQAATATPTATAGASPTPVQCVVQPIGIVLILENPSPGDTVLTGTQLVMNGIAYDTGATDGIGVASVVAYLGDRDTGGTPLGTATLGHPNPLAPPGSQFATAGFMIRTARLPAGSGAKTIFVYARSTVGNAEAILQVPVFLNSSPTPVKGQVPTAVLPTPPACTPTPTPTAASAPTSTPVAPAAATATPIAGSVATPTPPPAAPAPATPAPAAPAAAAPTVAPAATVAAVAPATATTAPRGGGIPSEVGLLLLGIGAAVVGGGYALRRLRR